MAPKLGKRRLGGDGRRRLLLETLEHRNPPGSMLTVLPHELLAGTADEAAQQQWLLQQRRRLLDGQSNTRADRSSYPAVDAHDLTSGIPVMRGETGGSVTWDGGSGAGNADPGRVSPPAPLIAGQDHAPDVSSPGSWDFFVLGDWAGETQGVRRLQPAPSVSDSAGGGGNGGGGAGGSAVVGNGGHVGAPTAGTQGHDSYSGNRPAAQPSWGDASTGLSSGADLPRQDANASPPVPDADILSGPEASGSPASGVSEPVAYQAADAEWTVIADQPDSPMGLFAGGLADGGAVGPGEPVGGVVLIEAGSPDPLDGWTVREFGGGSQSGSVTFQEGAFVLEEGDSFLVELSRTIEIPENPAFIEIEYSGTFDPAPSDRINDAFEIALLHPDGHSIVPTYRFGRDSHFNLTEGQPRAKGEGVLHTDHPFIGDAECSGILQVDISELPAGSTGELLVRLVNNNATTGTVFRLHVRETLLARDDAYQVLKNEVLTVTAGAGVLANDFSPYTATPTVALVDDVNNGALSLASDGSFAYTPNIHYSGTETFTYRVTDGVAWSNAATVAITVHPVNEPPVANPDFYAMVGGTTLVVDADQGLLANDADADGDALQVGFVSDPTHGDLLMHSDGSFTFTPPLGFVGLVTFNYRATDGFDPSNLTTVTIDVQSPLPSAKFFVANHTNNSLGKRTYVYGAGGQAMYHFVHVHNNVHPRDVAAHPTGVKIYLIGRSGANAGVYVYEPDGTFLGNWTPRAPAGGPGNKPLRDVHGIATDGTDVWILEDSGSPRRVYHYPHRADTLSGVHHASSSFNLHGDNMKPTGMDTRDGLIWVTDRGQGSGNAAVFVYTTAGEHLGSWPLPPENSNPAGITLDPSGGTDMWVVQAGTKGLAACMSNGQGNQEHDAAVFHYAGATQWRSPGDSAAPVGQWLLDPCNQSPEGIADPPVIVTGRPEDGQTYANGTSLLDHGTSSNAVYWIYDGDGSWNDPAMWSTAAVPGADDDVIIDRPGGVYTITIPYWESASANSLQVAENLVIETGASLTVSAASEFHGTLAIAGGTLAGAGSVTVTGALEWTGGTMSGTGATILGPGGTGRLHGGDWDWPTLGRTWINQGTVLWTAGHLNVDNNGSIANQAGAVFDVQAGGSLGGGEYGSTGGSFTNAGTFRKTGSVSAWPTNLSVAFENQSGGVLELSGGTLQFREDLANAGTVTIGAGTTLVVGDDYDGYMAGTSQYLQTAGQTALLGGTLTVAGTVALDGGILSGYGTVHGNLRSGGEVRPGTAAGPLNLVGDFTQTATGTLTFDLTAPDRLFRVTGGVLLAGDLNLLKAASVPLRGEYILLDHDASDAIAGAFAGLPAGATILVGGEPHVLTYAGGSGNDLSLRFPLAVVIEDVSALEGDSGTGVMAFRVTLPRALSQEVAIGYATKDGTAIAPHDYLAAAGSVSVPAGQTEAWFAVEIVGDEAPAADEIFFVELSSADVYFDSTARRVAVATILNDDNNLFHQTGQFVFTTTEDFHEGRLLNVTAHAVPDELRLDPADLGIFPFVNVPASSRGTVIRIDVRSGEVVGEYNTAPGWYSPDNPEWYEYMMGHNPSRTTVDLRGNVWVANRDEYSPVDGVSMGSVTRIGIVVGGTRGNKVGIDGQPWVAGQPWMFVPDPEGEYLQGPFQYSTAIDRDGDGLIRTSRGLGDILPWTNTDWADARGGVSTADDELIITYTRTLGTGTRAVAVDGHNDVWVGGDNLWHELLDGETGLPIENMHFNIGGGGYGALVDGNGVLWSTRYGGGLIRFLPDREDPPGVGQVLGNATGNYGIGLDPNTGHIWHTNYYGSLYELDALGNVVNEYPKPGEMLHLWIKGVAVDGNGHVWVAGSDPSQRDYIDERVWQLAPDPTSTPENPKKHVTVGTMGGFRSIHGVAVDAYGKVWVPEAHQASRIDPQAGVFTTIAGHAIPVGAVDLRVDIGADAYPYTYSDMTGFVSWNTFPQGIWTHTVDAEHLDALWDSVIAQATTPEGSSLELRVRASNDRATLDLLPYVRIESDQILQDITGRYFQVQVTLRSTSRDVIPSLQELIIECASVGPQIRVDSPDDDSRIAAGTTVLITGLASAGRRGVPLATVMIDGSPVDALDAAGAFFTQVVVAPGENTFEFTAIDVAGRTATTSLTLVGVPGDPSDQPWTAMTDLGQFSTEYHRTSFHERQNVLYVDLKLANTGPYAVDGPLYLGITNLSHPAVSVAAPAGVSSEGIPYFDFSHLVGPDGVFSPGETTDGVLTLSFFNPRRVPFTYQLVLVGEANRPPQFVSLPLVSAPDDRDYQYLARVIDPDGDAVRYSLTAAPVGMEVEEETGRITWAAAQVVAGNYSITVRAADEFGGSAEQSFTLAVYAPGPNGPPVFRSVPPVTAHVSGEYSYNAEATDPDDDPLTYSLWAHPDGLDIDSSTGVIEWRPAAEQVGDHEVQVRVTDGDHTAEQRFTVRVFAEAGNQPPVIVSQPVTVVLAGTEYRYQVVAVDPDRGDVVTYSLLDPIPNGMTIEGGLITWATPADNAGIRVRAADGRGGYDDQEFTLGVITAPAGSIAGSVFHDQNDNGVQDTGEDGLEGRVVHLDRNSNRRRDADEAWATTDVDGQYVLGHLLSGEYTVLLEQASGWRQGAPATPTVVSVGAGQSAAGPDFGVVPHTAANSPPYFTSTPPAEASVGVALPYTAAAEDPDQDPLEYTLAYSPAGMAVERFAGKLVWTPAPAQAGVVYAGIRVSDGRGGVAVQSLVLAVGGLGLAPVFTSQPVRVARLGQGTYTYDADAEDPIDSAAPVRYWLDQGSLLRGIAIDADTGVIQWPEPAAGLYDVTVWAANSAGQAAYQWYQLRVTDQTANQPPQVGPDVVLTIPAGLTWHDRAPALDPDDDPLVFTLVDPGSIAGLAMLSAPYESWLSWTPTLAQVNDPQTPYEFRVEVSDGQGHTVERAYRIDVVADVPQNRPSVITSSPRQVALVAEVYAYQAVAVDPEGHAVHWHLDQHPEGMTIDDQTGLLLWAPTTADLGNHSITVRAIDAFGASARQPYTLVVSAVNRPPYFTTPPRTWATVGQPYAYHVGAKDPDGQALRFELGPGPAEASIQPQTGLLTWTPETDDSEYFSVRVVDTFGLDAVQNFWVNVQPLPPNHPPIIRNAPEPVALVGNEYAWLVDAVDPDHKQSELVFDVSLEAVDPADAQLVALYANGLDGDDLAFVVGQANLLRWDSVPSALGGKAIWVTVTVTDPLEAAAARRYLLTLRENHQPTLTVADRSITAGQTFAYDVPAADADPDDVLNFALSAPAGSSVPAGMTIDPELGRIRWPGAVEGTYPLVVSVSDGIDTVHGAFTLSVLPDDQPPVVEFSLSRRVADVGQQVWVWVVATDDVGVTRRTLTIDGQPVALDGSGVALFTVQGDFGHIFALEATARDAAGNVSTPATTTLLIRNPDHQAPQIALTSPAAGAVVTELTEIVGSIVDPDGDLVAYTVTIAALDSAVPARVYSVAAGPGQYLSNLVDTRLGWLDATVLANGIYRVTVQAIDAEQRVAWVERVVEVEGNLKLGNFTLTFVDLELPVSGIPITITRTYDTLRSHQQGDFGYGWTMDIANVKVEVIQPGNDSGVPEPLFDYDRIVFTLPDDSKHGFTFQPKRVNPGSFINDGQYWPHFEPDAGVSSTLQMSGRHPALLQAPGAYLDAAMVSHQEYTPAAGLYGDYELTLRNGTRLYVDPRTGDLRQLVDRTGNSLTFTSGGIFHSAGRSVQFIRDHAERITEIILPDDTPADAEDNPRIKYTYDGNGDLRAFEDRSGAVTGLFYVSPQDPGYRPHYLDRIDDPLGRTAARTEYDADGRVAKVTDADGKSIEFTYDAESKTQSMTDQLGYQTVQQLDARGNVIYDENVATGGITLREYDDRDNLLWETVVLGQIDSPANGETDDLTTWYTYYPGTSDVWTTTDPRGNVTRNTYNQYGQPVTTSDVLGNTTTTHYDGRGLPSAIVDTNGVRTSLGFDAKGNLENVYNDQGERLVHSAYNSYGDVTSTTPAAGRTTYFDYDLDGHRVGSWYFAARQAFQPDPLQQDQILDVTHYDQSGRVTGTRRLVLPDGEHLTSNLAAVDFTAAGYTQYTFWSTGTQYNAAGQVTRSTDQFGNASETTYDLRGQTIQTRTQTSSVILHPSSFLLSRTFYDPKGRAVVTADSFVEDPDVTAANTSAFDPLTQTYGDFTFDNTTATTGTFSVYDGAGRVVRSYRLKDITIAVVTTTAGAATAQQAELRIGASTFVPPTDAAPNEQLYETWFRELTEFLESHSAIVSSSQTQYDNAGRVTSSFDQYGAETRTSYNRFGELVETRRQSRHAGGQLVWLVSRTVYDSQGRVQLSTDRYVEGSAAPVLATRTIYDDKGRAVMTVRLEGVEVDLVGGNTVVVNYGTELWRTETVHDAKGRVARSIGRYDAGDPSAPRPATDYEYDSLGRQVATIGPAVPDELTGELVRHRTESKYDAEGRLAESWVNIRVVVDAQGNVLTTSYAGKQVTAFEYDAYGRTTRTIYGVGTPIESYVAQGYDDFGRVIWESEQAPTSQQSPLKKEYEHDDFGRMTAVVLPEVAHPTLMDGQNPLMVHPRYEYGYDAWGNHVSIRDNVYQTAAGIFYEHGGTAGDFSQAFDTRVTELTYDAQGRQTSRTLPLGVATPDDPDDFVERRFYSDRSVAAAVAAGEPLTESVALGQPEYEISFEGVVTAYRYDNSATGGGRLVARYFYGGANAVADYLSDAANGSLTVADEAVVYGYDAFGRQVQVIQDRDGNLLTTADQRVESTEYDARSLISTVSATEGVLNYEYHPVTGQRTRTWSGTNPAAPVSDAHYVYDTLGRLDQVEVHWRNGERVDVDPNTPGFQPELTDYVFDLIGNLDQVRLPGGVVSDYHYDELNRLTLLRQFRDENQNGSYEAGVDALLAEFDYDLLPNGRRSGLSETLYNPATQSLEETRIDWTYDGLGRLVRDSYNSHHDDSLDFITDYVFDLVSNRLQKKTDTNPDWVALGAGLPTSPDQSVAYSYDLNDRLLVEIAATYDPGTSSWVTDQTTLYESGPNADPANGIGGDHTMQTRKTIWQGDDTDPETGTRLSDTQYEYNLQNRLSKAVIDSDNDGPSESTTVEYEYDSTGIRVSKVDGNDKILYLVDRHNPTGYAQVLAEIAAAHEVQQLIRSYTLGLDVISQAEAVGPVYYFLYDGHGSTRALLNASGLIIPGQVFAYDAYGNAIAFDPAQALTTFLYSGEQFDQRLQMQYLRARYYDPATGRFNRLDPFAGNVRDPLSFHKYMYTHADPITGLDPTGLSNTISTLSAIGIGLNLVSMGVNITNFGNAAARGDTAQANESLAWAMLDALFLLLPFSGPGAGLARTTAGTAIYVLSQAGIHASAIWGYATSLLHALAVSNISFATSSGGSSGGGSSSTDGPGNFEYSLGPGEFRSGAEIANAGSAFQRARTGLPDGWIYWLKQVKFDGFRAALNQLVETKTGGYQFLLDQEWFYRPAPGKTISGADALVAQARRQLNAAHGTALEVRWEVETLDAAAAIRQWLQANSVPVGPGGINIVVP